MHTLLVSDLVVICLIAILTVVKKEIQFLSILREHVVFFTQAECLTQISWTADADQTTCIFHKVLPQVRAPANQSDFYDTHRKMSVYDI